MDHVDCCYATTVMWGDIIIQKKSKNLATNLQNRDKCIPRSTHRTPNFTNPEYFVSLLFEYFFQEKGLD